MSSVNKVTLIGRLGADPEVRYTQGGQPVASLRMATSENWTDREGQRKERTEWHSITVWGKQAELCGQYLAKGRQVYIEGRLQTREYTDREGINRKAVEIVANQIVFLGGRGESSDSQSSWGKNSNNQGGWNKGANSNAGAAQGGGSQGGGTQGGGSQGGGSQGGGSQGSGSQGSGSQGGGSQGGDSQGSGSQDGGSQDGWGQTGGGNQGGWGQNNGGNQGGWNQKSDASQGTWGQTKPASTNEGGQEGNGGDDPIPF